MIKICSNCSYSEFNIEYDDGVILLICLGCGESVIACKDEVEKMDDEI